MNVTVKNWLADKGYGFVRPDDGNKDVFVHRNDILTSGVRDLTTGTRVTFERASTDKGDKGLAVCVIGVID